MTTNSELIRLNKLLAERGICSRRAADKMIEEGLVTVNGKRVYELGVRVHPTKDKIVVDGATVKQVNEKLYIMFHKPKSVITSMTDPLGRPTVADFMDSVPTRVFPIGRLDWDSEGLLILTNDGDYAQKVMHPKEEVTKTYHVKLDGQPLDYKVKKLLSGVSIPGGRVKARHIEKLKPLKSKSKKSSENYDWYKIVITEGKNHQVREMFKKIGYDVIKLQRVAIGKLKLGNLERGQFVYLNDAAAEKVFENDLPQTAFGPKPKRKASIKRAPADLKKSKTRSSK